MKTTPDKLGDTLSKAILWAVAKITGADHVMLALATTGASIIKRRTAKGLDKEGKAFDGYSKRYGDYRAAIGRLPDANLNVTGHMMNQLAAEAKGGTGRIYFLDGAMKKRPKVPGSTRKSKKTPKLALVGDVASYHNYGEGNNPPREFAGIDTRPEDIKAMKAVAEREIKALLWKEAP